MPSKAAAQPDNENAAPGKRATAPGDRAVKWRSLAQALLITALGMLGGLVLPLGALLALDALDMLPGEAGQIVLAVVLTQGVSFGGVALLVLRRRGPGVRAGLARVGVRWPRAHELGQALKAYLLALAGAGAGAAVAYLLGLEPGMNRLAGIAADDPRIFLMLIPISFLLIGPGEELLFRGVVQGRLREAFGPVAAVVLASVIFAGVHVFAIMGAPTGRAVTVAILLVPSLIFGTVYERTHNIAVPALVHGAYNATLFWLAYVATKAGPLSPPSTGLL